MKDESAKDIDSDADIEQLLSLAGPRIQPPADVEARVRSATMAAVVALPEPAAPKAFWRQPIVALAATVALSLVIGFLATRDSTPASAGEILYASGAYTIRGSEIGADDVAPGSIIRTTTGRMLIDLRHGRTLRIDEGASLTLHSDSEIWLHGGRIYIDSASGDPVSVVTPFASVTDVGTQFEVLVDGESLIVATREGVVNVQLGDEELLSRARSGEGEELKIAALELVSRAPVSTTGSRWSWTQRARPLFSVQDRTVLEYLRWSARESGRTLRFATPLAAQQAELRPLFGRHGEADADQATLVRILATSGFKVHPGDAHEIVVTLE